MNRERRSQFGVRAQGVAGSSDLAGQLQGSGERRGNLREVREAQIQARIEFLGGGSCGRSIRRQRYRRARQLHAFHDKFLVRQLSGQLQSGRAAANHPRPHSRPTVDGRLGVGRQMGRGLVVFELGCDVSVAPHLLSAERGKWGDVRQAQIQLRALLAGGEGTDLQREQPVGGRELQRAFCVVQLHGGVQREPRVPEECWLRARDHQPIDHRVNAHQPGIRRQVGIQGGELSAAGCLELLDQ